MVELNNERSKGAVMDLWFIEPVVVINEPWLYTERGGGRNQEPLDGWPETLISSLSLSISSLSLSLFIGHVSCTGGH